MSFLYSQIIINNLGNEFHKTTDISNPTFKKICFLKERNLQILGSDIRIQRQILLLRIRKVKRICRKLRNTELCKLCSSPTNNMVAKIGTRCAGPVTQRYFNFIGFQWANNGFEYRLG